MAGLLFARCQSGALIVKVKHDLALIICFVFALQVGHTVRAQGVTASIKGSVSATAGDASSRPELLPGSSLTLVNRDLQRATFKTVSDDTGNFAFLELPAGNYTLTAEADGLPRVTREIHLTTGANLVVDIVL